MRFIFITLQEGVFFETSLIVREVSKKTHVPKILSLKDLIVSQKRSIQNMNVQIDRKFVIYLLIKNY